MIFFPTSSIYIYINRHINVQAIFNIGNAGVLGITIPLLYTGEIKDQDMSFDMALLMELIVWFKNKFFTWVDQPACDKCGRATSLVSVSSVKTDLETCRAEVQV